MLRSHSIKFLSNFNSFFYFQTHELFNGKFWLQNIFKIYNCSPIYPAITFLCLVCQSFIRCNTYTYTHTHTNDVISTSFYHFHIHSHYIISSLGTLFLLQYVKCMYKPMNATLLMPPDVKIQVSSAHFFSIVPYQKEKHGVAFFNSIQITTQILWMKLTKSYTYRHQYEHLSEHKKAISHVATKFTLFS